MKDNNKSLIDTAAEIAEAVLPEVQSVLASAFSTAQAGAASASESLSDAASASTEKIKSTVDGSGSNRGRALLSVLIIGGLIAVAAVVIQRILSARGEDAGDNWTSAYTPAAPDAQAPADETAAEAPADEATTEADEGSA